MSEGWLKCKILKGMFSDEKAMVYPAESASPSSFFVPKDQVCEEDGTVHVRVFHEGDTLWAIVPAESQPVIPVDEEDLTPCA